MKRNRGSMYSWWAFSDVNKGTTLKVSEERLTVINGVINSLLYLLIFSSHTSSFPLFEQRERAPQDRAKNRKWSLISSNRNDEYHVDLLIAAKKCSLLFGWLIADHFTLVKKLRLFGEGDKFTEQFPRVVELWGKDLSMSVLYSVFGLLAFRPDDL